MTYNSQADNAVSSDSTTSEDIPTLVLSRMTSRRLPGKALRPIVGKPLIRWVVDTCSASELASAVFVATSSDSSDEPIRKWCEAHDVDFCLGSLTGAVSRLADCASSLGAEAVVRISGDSPLLDPNLIDYAIHLYRTNDVDVVTNVRTRTFPKGQSVEVIRADLLRELASRRLSQSYREHVTSAVYEGIVPARVQNFTVEEQAPDFFNAISRRETNLASINLSVDTLEDVMNVKKVIRALSPITPAQAGWARCTEAYLHLAAEGQ